MSLKRERRGKRGGHVAAAAALAELSRAPSRWWSPTAQGRSSSAPAEAGSASEKGKYLLGVLSYFSVEKAAGWPGPRLFNCTAVCLHWVKAGFPDRGQMSWGTSHRGLSSRAYCKLKIKGIFVWITVISFLLEMHFFFLTAENAGFLMPTLGLQTSDISRTAKLLVLLVHRKHTSLPSQKKEKKWHV